MTERLIAISIGDAIDREALGFPEREIKRVLFAVCTAFIRRGFRIAYAGDLRPEGFTYAIFDFLSGTYAGQGTTPFVYVVPGSVSNKLDSEKAMELVRRTRSVATILLVRGGKALNLASANGRLVIGPPGPDRISVQNDAQWSDFLNSNPVGSDAEALTDARATIAGLASGCVAMGGKMGRVGEVTDQFQGKMPGVVEEALQYLQAGKPFVPLAAFGGATRDIAISLLLLPEGQKTPRGEDNAAYLEALESVKGYRQKASPVFSLMQSAATQEGAEDAAQIALEIIDPKPATAAGA